MTQGRSWVRVIGNIAVDHVALEHLAIEAKTSFAAFADLLTKVEPLLEHIVNKYDARWNIERDELLQWMRIEVWNAVKLFQPGRMPFLYLCRVTVANHIKKRLYRLHYGKRSAFNRSAIHIDYWAEKRIEGPSCKSKSPEEHLFRSGCLMAIHNCLNELNLTDLEARCMWLFYLEEYTYGEIKDELNLPSKKPIDNALGRVRKKLRENATLQSLYRDLQEV